MREKIKGAENAKGKIKVKGENKGSRREIRGTRPKEENKD